jgi:hypothetical protein
VQSGKKDQGKVRRAPGKGARGKDSRPGARRVVFVGFGTERAEQGQWEWQQKGIVIYRIG